MSEYRQDGYYEIDCNGDLDLAMRQLSAVFAVERTKFLDDVAAALRVRGVDEAEIARRCEAQGVAWDRYVELCHAEMRREASELIASVPSKRTLQ